MQRWRNLIVVQWSVLLALVVLGATSILFAGGKSLERFKNPSLAPAVRGGVEDTPARSAEATPSPQSEQDQLRTGAKLDFRIQLQLDTLRLLAATPLLGTGPGI